MSTGVISNGIYRAPDTTSFAVPANSPKKKVLSFEKPITWTLREFREKFGGQYPDLNDRGDNAMVHCGPDEGSLTPGTRILVYCNTMQRRMVRVIASKNPQEVTDVIAELFDEVTKPQDKESENS